MGTLKKTGCPVVNLLSKIKTQVTKLD